MAQRRASGDEGAPQTALIMAVVKTARVIRGWSATRLAEEMTAAGVPWDRSVVANLENGRRKTLRVHELMTLAYVLDVDSPLDLLVPMVSATYPLTPDIQWPTQMVREWSWKDQPPPRRWQAMSVAERQKWEIERAKFLAERGILPDGWDSSLAPMAAVKALSDRIARLEQQEPEDGTS
jgi:transcriptional regulator with XRE-family HTH domain